MVWVLGLDGGGTKTDVALADASGAVRRWRTGGLDPMAGPGWEALLAQIAGQAPVVAAVLGLPCHGEIAAVSARQVTVSQQLFGTLVQVRNDVDIAHEGAFAGGEGVLLLAGTGAMAWARGPLGTHRVGGWGDLFGDEGSAHWIGRAALGLAAQGLDGRSDPGFATALLNRMGVAPGDLMAWAAEQGRAGIAGVAALVSTLDLPQARALMQSAADALADQALTAARLSGATGWSHAGSVLQDPTIRAALLHRLGPPQPPLLPPVGGAVLAAARLAGWTAEPAFLPCLQAAFSD